MIKTYIDILPRLGIEPVYLVTLSCFAKKVRMGKRIEKAFGKDKGASPAQDRHEDDPNKTPEPYVCAGHFHSDFHELCRRNQLVVIPPVVARGRRPLSPSITPVIEEKVKPGKKDDKKNLPPPPEPEPEPELDENGEPVEPPPKTYTTKEKFEYFKPTVQVEMENPDKEESVTQVFVRGWKIDVPMMMTFKQCFAKLDRLNTINFWHTGLDDETLEMLATIVNDSSSMRNLVLDNNPVHGQGYHNFMREESPLINLSLRYNQITDKGAELIGRALGTPQISNQKLLSLNLNGNRITDAGIEFISKGLRSNRTLLTLGLGNNQIGDKGVKKLAEVISCFALTHEEIVERRKLQSEKSPDRQKSDGEEEASDTILRPQPGSRRGDSRDRPGSVRSLHAGKSTKGKSAKDKKDGKKDDHDKTKGKKDDKGTKKGSIVQDTGKTKDKGKTKGKGKGATMAEVEPSESSENQNPLLDNVEHLDNGVIMLPGNRTLISLNLARNQIGEEGMQAFLLAIGYQTTLAHDPSKTGGTGLMRLCVQKNRLARDSESLTKLNNLMQTKDPFYKPPILTPDLESNAS